MVTLSDKWQSVSGKLAQASGAPATDFTVVVFPADKAALLASLIPAAVPLSLQAGERKVQNLVIR